ncbi:glycosyltransferase family 2 protein [Parasediminibacterium sp. JCM 36343]|uniref:glycosyltransferase family 2 protein n=1 Tax=Parasediminibacterium sp. JCM 36343 TaxID=3374279 RepID=UPI003977E59E
MANVSAYIIGYNEERKIKQAIDSVIGWASEVIVVDSFSTDKTAEIAALAGAKVVQVPFEGFGKLRNDAIDNCKHDWIFSLDADERCTPEARDEIKKIITEEYKKGQPVAYYVPRKNFFLGQWIKHSGWYPDYRQPQLFRKNSMRYMEDAVHERYKVEGETGIMKNAIWQYPFENLEQILAKTNRYSSLGAQKLLNKKKGGLRVALLHGITSFIQTYFIKKGFLDGRAGLVIAMYNFTSTYYKYIKLAELQHNWKEPTGIKK